LHEETFRSGGVDFVIVKGGAGKPLLILHDELDYPGWMTWNERPAYRAMLSGGPPGAAGNNLTKPLEPVEQP